MNFVTLLNTNFMPHYSIRAHKFISIAIPCLRYVQNMVLTLIHN